MIGKVIEVFIPNHDLNINYIGFKVLVSEEVITVVEKVNEEIAGIMKHDYVYLEKINGSNVKIIKGEK